LVLTTVHGLQVNCPTAIFKLQYHTIKWPVGVLALTNILHHAVARSVGTLDVSLTLKIRGHFHPPLWSYTTFLRHIEMMTTSVVVRAPTEDEMIDPASKMVVTVGE
jgi:hypothetical protein